MTDPYSPRTPASPLPATPLAALRILARGSGHRIQLASIELAQARIHAITSGVIGAFAIGLSLIAGFSITLCIAAMVWESPNRMMWLTSICLVYVALAAAVVAILLRRMMAWRPFTETTHQLISDYQCLRQLIDQAAL
jgi:uncharacterized membrane protein YqjE